MKSGLFIFSLILVAFSLSSLQAQSKGLIKGRVVAEEGGGLPNVTVSIAPAAGNRSSRPLSTLTDEEGRFEFTDLSYTRHLITVMSSGVYVQPLPEPGMRTEHLPGENVTITMIRGGVITGRVTGSNGEPIVGIQISAIRIRNEEGASVRIAGPAWPRFTDDRGIYRIYGLSPGTYLVVANFGQRNNFTTTPFDGEAPTFHPSSTRDTAVEVSVSAGSEISGVDIRYRGEPGHVVSGRMTSADGRPIGQGAMAYLLFDGVGIPAGFSLAQQTAARQAGDRFEIRGINDGEYDLIGAQGFFGKESGYFSVPQKVSVRGSDVSGIELKMLRLATVEGTLRINDAGDSCPGVPGWSPESAVVSASRDQKNLKHAEQFFQTAPPPTSPDASGRFTIASIFPGRNHLSFRLPEGFYLKSIKQIIPASDPRTKQAEKDISDWIELKAGEKQSGLNVTVGRGAGTIAGKVIPEKDGGRLPSRLSIHLIPVEKESVDNVLRYAGMHVRDDRSFAFNNIAPGRYRLLAHPVPTDEAAGWAGSQTMFDPAEREKLRKEAEARPFEIELKPCQRISDLIIRF